MTRPPLMDRTESPGGPWIDRPSSRTRWELSPGMGPPSALINSGGKAVKCVGQPRPRSGAGGELGNFPVAVGLRPGMRSGEGPIKGEFQRLVGDGFGKRVARTELPCHQK